MIIDKRLQVSTLQALTGTVASTDAIDLSQQTRIIGPGDPLWWVIASRVALAGGTMIIAIQTDDNTGFGSPATLLTSPTLQVADFPLGKLFVMPMAFTNERYLRLNYTLGAATATVDAWLTNQDPMTWVSMPDLL